ncbi:uncharacterized protein TNCV_1527501 [Trichonephila clavipes]|nr:uncharacterized protein TNCV_1527501 [Trichonephila clavipes]
MIFYDFKARLNQEECIQGLQLAFDEESPCHATVFRWFKEFFSGRNSLQDEEHTGRLRSAVIPENVPAIRKLLMDGVVNFLAVVYQTNRPIGFSMPRSYALCLHTHVYKLADRTDKHLTT